MEKKKILCLTDCLGSGGAQRQLVGLAKLLSEQNYIVNVLCYHSIPFYKEYLDRSQISNYCIPETTNVLKRILLLRNEVIKYAPDVLIAYQEVPSLIACILKLMVKTKMKLIVSERNTTQKVGRLEKLRFFLYRWSEYVVPNSFTQGNFLLKHYPNLKNKIKVITNFVDTDTFKPTNLIHNKIPIIVIVASEKKEKNFYRLVNAVALLKQRGYHFKVEWWGIANIALTTFREYVESIGLNEIITVYPPQKDIHLIYQKSDFFCLPSLFEGFPNALCEAMSCGLPVAASAICDNPCIIEDGINGFLFNPILTEDITNKLEKLLLMNQDELQKMKERNRNKAVSLFSKQSFLNKYIDIIENS